MDIVTLIGIIWEDVFKVKKCLEEMIDSGYIKPNKEVIAYYFPVGDQDKWFKERSYKSFPPSIGFVTNKQHPKTFLQYGLMKFTLMKAPESKFRLAISSHLDDYEIRKAIEIGMRARNIGVIKKDEHTQDMCFEEFNSVEKLEHFLLNYKYPEDYYTE